MCPTWFGVDDVAGDGGGALVSSVSRHYCAGICKARGAKLHKASIEACMVICLSCCGMTTTTIDKYRLHVSCTCMYVFAYLCGHTLSAPCGPAISFSFSSIPRCPPATHARMKGQPYMHAGRPPVTTALTHASTAACISHIPSIRTALNLEGFRYGKMRMPLHSRR